MGWSFSQLKRWTGSFIEVAVERSSEFQEDASELSLTSVEQEAITAVNAKDGAPKKLPANTGEDEILAMPQNAKTEGEEDADVNEWQNISVVMI